MSFCKNCESEHVGESNFCRECGKSLKGIKQEQGNEKNIIMTQLSQTEMGR